jgi:hypothetical protein
LFFIWKLGFISYSSSIKSFINTPRVFLHIIFSFSKDYVIFNFHKRVQLWDWEKKTKQMYDNSKDQNLSYNLKCKNSQNIYNQLKKKSQSFL